MGSLQVELREVGAEGVRCDDLFWQQRRNEERWRHLAERLAAAGGGAAGALLCADRHHVQPFMIGLEGGELATVFRRMSLNRLFQQWTPPMPTYAPQRATSNEPQPADRADQMLRAHETLAELSPENTREFAQVIALLRGQETPHQTQTVNHEQ